MPNTIEDYVHRIGRTGRAGKSGTAVSFFGCDFRSNDKVRFAKRLVKVMQAIGKGEKVDPCWPPSRCDWKMGNMQQIMVCDNMCKHVGDL